MKLLYVKGYNPTIVFTLEEVTTSHDPKHGVAFSLKVQESEEILFATQLVANQDSITAMCPENF